MMRGVETIGRKKDNDQLREERALDRLKWETAEQLGLADHLQDADELSVREAGKIGGKADRLLPRQWQNGRVA